MSSSNTVRPTNQQQSDINKQQSNIIQSTPNLVKVLLIFYIIVASNCTENLLSKQTRELLNNNRYIQHILGFMTLFVLITLIDDQIDTSTALIYTISGYLLFVLSTKLDIHWTIAIVILLFIGYMYQNNIQIRINEINNDTSLSAERKLVLLNEIETTNKWIIGSIIVVAVLGTIFYTQKKQEQYGGGYDIIKYILN